MTLLRLPNGSLHFVQTSLFGKEHGITKEEAVEIVTQLAFYCGWPKAWSTFPMIAVVWPDEEK